MIFKPPEFTIPKKKMPPMIYSKYSNPQPPIRAGDYGDDYVRDSDQKEKRAWNNETQLGIL